MKFLYLIIMITRKLTDNNLGSFVQFVFLFLDSLELNKMMGIFDRHNHTLARKSTQYSLHGAFLL